MVTFLDLGGDLAKTCENKKNDKIFIYILKKALQTNMSTTKTVTTDSTTSTIIDITALALTHCSIRIIEAISKKSCDDSYGVLIL